MSSSDPLFRFYFDGEEAPRFSLRLSEFGEKAPFIKPLAESYIGPFDNGRGPIRVARSFVPMAFNKGCRVTTDVKLEGYDRTKGEGGWGHVVYHTYTDNGIKTFTGKENYDTLIQLWKKQGSSFCVMINWHIIESRNKRSMLVNALLYWMKRRGSYRFFKILSSGD